MCSFNFKQWVLKFLNESPKNIYTVYRKCPDNYIGTISKNSSNLFVQKELRYQNKEKLLKVSKKNIAKIVLLLESPHKDEFMINLTAPALGTTGEKIHSYFHKLLSKYAILTDIQMEVYIVNIIQFQCSLGFNTKKYRDKLFKELWEKPQTRRSLKRRIKKINPQIIINATTYIKSGQSTIKEEVTKYLKLLGIKIWEASMHPVLWNDSTTLKEIF